MVTDGRSRRSAPDLDQSIQDGSRDDLVRYTVADGIAEIELCRPERLNAVTPELVEHLCDALDRATRDSVAAVILTGEGRAFCAGHDLKQNDDELAVVERQRRLHRIQDVTRKVRQSTFPVIAAVNGYALGAGCEFALCCDLVVAAYDAIFGFPEVEVGLGITGGISHVLPLTVGLAKAKELVLLGEHVTAERAATLNLVNRVVEPSALVTAARELATTIRSRPGRAIALAKQVLDRGAQSGIDAAYDTEVTTSLLLQGSDEAITAAAAFRNRVSSEGSAGS